MTLKYMPTSPINPERTIKYALDAISQIDNGELFFNTLRELVSTQIVELCQFEPIAIAKKLQSLPLKNSSCSARHHVSNVDPESCPFSKNNPNCIHIEYNGILALLLVGEHLITSKNTISQQNPVFLFMQKLKMDVRISDATILIPGVDELLEAV